MTLNEALAALRAVIAVCAGRDTRIAELEVRRDELLALTVRLTNEVPFPDEVRGWTAQRAAMIAEVGTLRARNAELESDVQRLTERVSGHELDAIHTAAGDERSMDAISMLDWPSMVRDFHAVFGCVDAVEPDISQHRDLRIALIAEEFKELRDALEDDDVVEVADALADLIYVVVGSALQWGIPIGRVFREVHRSNMSKTGGPRRPDGKVLKGPNYSPPDIKSILESK